MSIGIINTKTSNIKSVFNALHYLNFRNFQEISSINDTKNKKFTHLILPGNGSFKSNINTIKDQELDRFLIESYNNNIFYLGICVGMQILATYGEEHSKINGLNIIPGKVEKIPVRLKRLPHIGWNSVEMKKEDPIFFNLQKQDNIFYFLHSYYFNLNNSCILSTAKYDLEFPVVVRKKNFYGVQFHPEKSQLQGLKLIKNFLELK